MNNQNLPPIPVFIDNYFLYNGSQTCRPHCKTAGHLMAVRARSNQALQFTVLLDNGALFTGLPASAITFTESQIHPILPLPDCQMWDCISDDIEVFTIESLRYAECCVKGDQKIFSGMYLFTIDFVGEGYSRHPVHWKQLHAIKTNDGYFVLYPQYRLQFTDKALLEDEKLPKYEANSKHWIVGS